MSRCRKSGNTGTSVAGKSWLGVLFVLFEAPHVIPLVRPVRAGNKVESLGGWDGIDDGERSDKKMVDLCR